MSNCILHALYVLLMFNVDLQLFFTFISTIPCNFSYLFLTYTYCLCVQHHHTPSPPPCERLPFICLMCLRFCLIYTSSGLKASTVVCFSSFECWIELFTFTFCLIFTGTYIYYCILYTFRTLSILEGSSYIPVLHVYKCFDVHLDPSLGYLYPLKSLSCL